MKFTLVFAFLLATLNVHHALAQSARWDDEIANIASRPDIQGAFAAVDALEPQTMANHVLLAEIEAPPFKEGPRAIVYAELLRTAGVDSVWIDAEGNVLGLRRGRVGGRTVALDAHLDTVFPEGTDVTVKVRGDTLAAPGIGDDTRGLTTVLTVLKAMNEAQIETQADILFVGTVGEEGLGDLRGVKYLFGPEGPQIDAWIAVDGLSVEGVTHRGLGSHRYRITFKGPGGHSWGAFGLGNPHHALGTAIERFVQYADAFTETGERTSYNVGRIGGGTSVNSVPFEAWMEVDMRSVSPVRLVQIDSLLQRAVREGLEDANARARRGDPLTVDIDLIGDRPSGAIAEDTPLVQRALAATRHAGKEPRLGIGSTDSNIPIALGVPAITIGGGGTGSGAHALDEWFINEDGALGIKRALLITVAEAGLVELVN
jgi:acetylornithine deacetylase/succinyl-diaminopimelate desuccinylase-like protein